MAAKFELTEEEYHEHADACDGICLACGGWTCGGVEPDAENYRCEECGEHKVTGAENALLDDALQFTDEEG